MLSGADFPVGNATPKMTISKEDVSAVLTAWGEERLLPLKGFGDSAVYHAITESSAHRLELQTQYETRSYGAITQPAPPDQATPLTPSHAGGEDPRAAIQHVTSARLFVKSSHELIVPESHRVAKCEGCEGAGQRRCTSCSGSGHTRCGFCGGMGTRTVVQQRQHRDGQGRTVFRSETVHQPCGSCHSGKRPCTHCSRTGYIRCATCSGHRNVHTWDTITHSFEPRRDLLFFNETELDDGVVQSAPGESVWSGYLGTGSAVPSLPAPLKTQLDEALATTTQVTSPERRVLHQHLAISRIPVNYVVYSAGKTRAHLWIYGVDRRVHAPSETGIRGLWNRLRR